jgi:hypothetical protein
MVREVIEGYLPADQLKVLRVAEDNERDQIASMVELFTRHSG